MAYFKTGLLVCVVYNFADDPTLDSGRGKQYGPASFANDFLPPGGPEQSMRRGPDQAFDRVNAHDGIGNGDDRGRRKECCGVSMRKRRALHG
jgi:hypothetical protein